MRDKSAGVSVARNWSNITGALPPWSLQPSWDQVELNVVCQPILFVDVKDSCNSPSIACGDSDLGTNIGYPSFVGSAAADALFLSTAWEPTLLALTTYSPKTDFYTWIVLYDGWPWWGGKRVAAAESRLALNVSLLATSDASADMCELDGQLTHGGSSFGGTLVVDLQVVGTYYIVVEGRARVARFMRVTSNLDSGAHHCLRSVPKT